MGLYSAGKVQYIVLYSAGKLQYIVLYSAGRLQYIGLQAQTPSLLLLPFSPHFFSGTARPPVGQVLLIHEVSRSHSTTHHSRQDSSGRVISPSHRPLPDNTQLSQQTDIHTLDGIRTRNPSRRAAPDLRLRPRRFPILK